MMESPMVFDETIKYMSKVEKSYIEHESDQDHEVSDLDVNELDEEEDEERRKRFEAENILINLIDYKDDCVRYD